jgi:hypothetical protein
MYKTPASVTNEPAANILLEWHCLFFFSCLKDPFFIKIEKEMKKQQERQ